MDCTSPYGLGASPFSQIMDWVSAFILYLMVLFNRTGFNRNVGIIDQTRERLFHYISKLGQVHVLCKNDQSIAKFFNTVFQPVF